MTARPARLKVTILSVDSCLRCNKVVQKASTKEHRGLLPVLWQAFHQVPALLLMPDVTHWIEHTERMASFELDSALLTKTFLLLTFTVANLPQICQLEAQCFSIYQLKEQIAKTCKWLLAKLLHSASTQQQCSKHANYKTTTARQPHTCHPHVVSTNDQDPYGNQWRWLHLAESCASKGPAASLQ